MLYMNLIKTSHRIPETDLNPVKMQFLQTVCQLQIYCFITCTLIHSAVLLRFSHMFFVALRLFSSEQQCCLIL